MLPSAALNNVGTPEWGFRGSIARPARIGRTAHPLTGTDRGGRQGWGARLPGRQARAPPLRGVVSSAIATKGNASRASTSKDAGSATEESGLEPGDLLVQPGEGELDRRALGPGWPPASSGGRGVPLLLM